MTQDISITNQNIKIVPKYVSQEAKREKLPGVKCSISLLQQTHQIAFCRTLWPAKLI